MKRMKKGLALLLAACMLMPGTATIGAGMHNVRAAEAAQTSLVFEESDITITQGTPADLSGEAYAGTVKTLEEATVVVKFTSTSTFTVQSLFSISNSSAGNDNRHFHIYVTPAGRLGCEIRNDNGFNYHIYVDNAVKAGDENVIAFKADKANGQYKLFANGLLVKTMNASDFDNGYKFASDITGVDNIELGATKRGGAQKYTFGGTIHSVQVYNAALDDETILEKVYVEGGVEGGAAISTMFDASLRDNTWVFTGGEAVQGGFDQTRGVRNYIGQFEEYIRWTIGGSSPINGRQRFTFNLGLKGRTLSDIADNYETLIAAYKTKAAAYMVGVEDYSQGESALSEFKADLKSFIDQSLALKNGSGFAVVQKPFAVKDDENNAVIDKYCEAVDEVVNGYETNSDKFARIVVVDHFTATNNADFKANRLNEDGTLNAKGHLEIGRQLALATCGVSGEFPRAGVALNLVEEEQPQQYLDVQPKIEATEDSLKVEIPAEAGKEWKYELKLEDVLVTGTSDKASFEITDLVQGSDYVLKIQSLDGTKQLVTTKGTVKNGDKAVKNVQELNKNQQKIADLVEGKEPVTWLFMGDSITHACQFTSGYDGVAQIFDEFVKEELGRTNDVVLNTAVSNANTDTTLQEIDQRLTNYDPDVISIMIGTNDCVQRVGINVEKFKSNMITIIEKMKEVNPDAVIILRSPAPVFDNERIPTVKSYINVLKELAATYDLIYVDQFTEWNGATTTYHAWLKNALFPDGLHPNANGHRIMTNMFLKAIGLWTEDSTMTNLFYDMGIKKETNKFEPEILVGAEKLGVNVAELKTGSGLSVGDVTVKATSRDNGQSYQVNAKSGEAFAVVRNLPGETTYEVEVSAYLTTAAKKVTFVKTEVTLNNDTDFSEEVTLPKAGSINVSKNTVTKGQPLAAGTGGSAKFRIPALITLDNGDLLAAADARWTGGADWGGLDTIASVSSDNGATWSYSFPIWFPDTNEQYPGNGVGTTAIDPVLVQGKNGTIYCIADMNPSGITTGDIMPAPETGYVEINGTQRLVLTGTYVQPTSRNWATYGDPEDYEYYVGDFDEEGFAKVFNKSDHSATKWVVDEWYNIYELDAETNTYKPLTQTMANDTDIIQQNAFYKDSVLHVYNTGYLWLVTSTDNGRSWGNPTILNTQIKRAGEVALLASPGQGITTSGGDIVIPFYDHGDNQENASVIWSDDNGKTWTRSNDVSGMWSSESEVVELNNGVLRMFFRNGTNYMCYADITKVDGKWTMGTGVQTSIPVCSTCNVSAIRHSETIDGKMVVMVACPGGSGRANGKIFTFLVNEDNTMELYHTFSVNEGYYAYSCMTETADGKIGLLWENESTAIRYDEFEFEEVIGTLKNITLDPEESYVEETTTEKTPEVTQMPDEEIAVLTNEYVVEEAVIALHDHTANNASSLTSFSESAGTATLDEAEFTFTASGNNWKIYNATKGVYLTNESVASTFFASSAADMKVEPVDGEFRISKANGTRYVIFFNTQMDFNSNSAYNASFTAGSYELVLLEKQDAVSETDVIPGYKRVSEVTNGKNYLITYIWEDGSVIVLYPTNGTAAQTKLVGEKKDSAKHVLTITGVAPGETTAVVDGVTYKIKVNDPTTSPSYAGNDLPTEGMAATAGSLEPTEGSLEALFDGNPDSFYHSNWSGTRPTEDDFWITIELPEVTEVSGLRYLPRQSSANGRILEYVISYSLDGKEWTEITSGKWADDATWKLARFGENVEAKYVKIFAIDSKPDTSGRHLTAAELRVVKAMENVTPPVEETGVVRLFGSGRYETGYAVADALKAALGVEKFEAVVVATGTNFADALAGSYLAVERHAPILLTNGKDANVAQLHAYIKANVAEGGKVYILGGDGAVPETVDAIKGYKVVRLFGDSRYDTNLEILKEAGVTGDSIIVATGKTFADSLSASAAKLPILLVKPNEALSDAQKEILTGRKNIYIVGGDGAVSTAYEAELKEFGEVTRVFGESRYDTSVEVAKTFCKDVDLAVVASGKNFPDGLCGGPFAAALNAPLVLTKDGGTDAAAAYVAENAVASGYVLGGDGALTDATVVEVFGLESTEEIK